MRFKIVYSNYRQVILLEDYLLLLRLLLEAAGHQVHYDDHLWMPGCCYVFVENFTMKHAATMAEIQRGGSDSIIVATEHVTGETFNDFDATYDGGHYTQPDYWRARFQAFRACARHARAVWCASSDPQQVALYQDLVEDVPVAPLPFPHFPDYPALNRATEKDVALFFSGTITAYRWAIIKRLGERHKTFASEPFVPEAVRREIASRSKICLNLKQGPNWQFPSMMRYWYHLSNGSFVLGEQCPSACALDPYVRAVPADQLDAACDELLAGGQWEPLAAEAHERFAAERPARPAAEELLDRSFSRRG